ncbi:class I SAM-dependent methyltransferase [Candidatus Marimicrobium litorale]|uniref:Class I SAM-dependent methyltransferase n=1 Tax=Candidatus Marimicrobium litorale TaxID=2518991 RepID=A0ABT3T612_9GAMM|nr:class I SAM-dependent methyltransferase [Candidatus Marimicrobium litorale]MCX2977270.1 class I SAM-dependent methyltransferase [Candidatus Marimicrobium litorale]
MERGYQHGYSGSVTSMFDIEGRRRKARTMVSVLSECSDRPLAGLHALNVGGSAGIIDEYLSRHFASVTGIDIDETAIQFARKTFNNENLHFETGDAMALRYEADTFDVVVCSQVYEHVPDAGKLMAEMYRVLKPGGKIYFAAGNRLMYREPHYNLPLLAVIPRPLAHRYLRLVGKGEYYYEKHFTYWGLKHLVCSFSVTDYTPLIIRDPDKYQARYMMKTGTLKHGLARFISRYAIWLVPGYIWVLEKPMTTMRNAEVM